MREGSFNIAFAELTHKDESNWLQFQSITAGFYMQGKLVYGSLQRFNLHDSKICLNYVGLISSIRFQFYNSN